LELEGCRKSESISSVRCPDAAAETAMAQAMVDLPSPGTLEVTSTSLGGLSTFDSDNATRADRTASLNRAIGLVAT
jgi:hypothetical protein